MSLQGTLPAMENISLCRIYAAPVLYKFSWKWRYADIQNRCILFLFHQVLIPLTSENSMYMYS